MYNERNIKSLHILLNIVISCVGVIVVACILIFTFMDDTPKNLKEKTGTIARFKQYDEKWYDDYLPESSGGSYFNVTLEDGSFFVARGASYDNIDKTLFKDIRVGGEIKITYERGDLGGSNSIYAIEYNGKPYLLLDTVLKARKDGKKDDHIMGVVLACVFAVIFGLLLFALGLMYRKKSPKAHNSF
ncbi:MAG: hypothetical protein K2M95_03695 [Clostridiales bacterium]|nr:hypothetical protein [Clostridiales bacterium]